MPQFEDRRGRWGKEKVSRFHFVHAAGLRLNAPFRDVGRTPARISDELCNASARAWDDLIDLCIHKSAAFLVLSGGIDAAENVGLRGHLQLVRGLARLAEHDIPVCLALGPNDEAVAMTMAGEAPKGVVVFGADQPSCFTVERGGQAIACVAGQSAHGRGAIDYAGFFTDVPPGVALIGALPASIDALESHLDEMANKASYWALGHSDEPSRRGFSPWIVESGTLQSRSADDQGARGAMLVEVEGARAIAVDHVALDRIRYATLRIAPKHALGDALLCHQILDELNRLRASHSGRGLIVSIEIESGTVDVAVATAEVESVLDDLRAQTASWDPFVWCNGIRVLPMALEDQQPSEPLAVSVVQEARALPANPLQRSYYFAQRFDPLMRRWTAELASSSADELLANATQLALHQIREGTIR